MTSGTGVGLSALSEGGGGWADSHVGTDGLGGQSLGSVGNWLEGGSSSEDWLSDGARACGDGEGLVGSGSVGDAVLHNSGSRWAESSVHIGGDGGVGNVGTITVVLGTSGSCEQGNGGEGLHVGN